MTRRGLTLVELVITIALAAIIGIPAGVILSEHLRGALRARDYTVAMNLARYEMEQLDSFNDFFHADLALPTDPATTTFVNYQGYPYTLQRTVTCLLGDCTDTDPTTGTQGVKQITIVVTKTTAGDLLATLVTYRTKHVSFGG